MAFRKDLCLKVQYDYANRSTNVCALSTACHVLFPKQQSEMQQPRHEWRMRRVCVCLCMCVCACMDVSTHACVCMYAVALRYPCVSAYMCLRVSACLRSCLCVCICAWVYVYVRAWLCVQCGCKCACQVVFVCACACVLVASESSRVYTLWCLRNTCCHQDSLLLLLFFCENETKLLLGCKCRPRTGAMHPAVVGCLRRHLFGVAAHFDFDT